MPGRQQERDRAERERHRILADLRQPPFDESDRDRGLERGWARRLSGAHLRGPAQVLHLADDGRYRREPVDGTAESGGWSVWSNVGRACLMLHPDDGQEYGFVLARDAGGDIALNGVGYCWSAS